MRCPVLWAVKMMRSRHLLLQLLTRACARASLRHQGKRVYPLPIPIPIPLALAISNFEATSNLKSSPLTEGLLQPNFFPLLPPIRCLH